MTPARLALLQSKWRILPDRQTNAVLYKQTAPGSYASGVNLSAAFRRPGKGLYEMDISKGVYLMDETEWWIPKVVYPDQPYPGDYVQWPHPTLGTLAYTIGKEGVNEVGALGSWQLKCVRPHFNPGLTRLVTVYRPQPGQDPGGGVTRGLTAIIAGPIGMALQQFSSFSPNASAVGGREEWGKRITPVPVRIYSPISFRVQPHDFAEDDQGLRYTVEADSNFGVLGEFMALDTFLIPHD